MKTISDVLKLCQDHLKAHGVPNVRRQSEDLVSLALGIKRLEVYTQFDRPLMESELEVLRSYLKRRAKREPIAYIHGTVDFFDTEISVSPAVLIPRQETEQLVSIIADFLKNEELIGKKMADICTGSGCIAISLKKKLEELCVYASDFSKEALLIAERNALDNNVKILFENGDLLAPFIGQKFDYITINPPYIKQNDYQTLEPEVKAYEPHLALVSGQTGYEFYERLAATLHDFLNSSGKVWMEIGAEQGEQVIKLFSNSIWVKKVLLQDWSGRDRFFFLEKE